MDKKPNEVEKQQAKAVVDELIARFDASLGRGIRKRIVIALIVIGSYLIYIASGFKFPHA